MSSSASSKDKISPSHLETLIRNADPREAERVKSKFNIVWWAEKFHYIPDTEKPIVLLPHQKAILRYIFKRNENGRFPFTTAIWSAPKKSGKTEIAGLVGEWAAETWGKYGEILCVGNDAEQARERAYKAIKTSIELRPDFNRSRGVLPHEWILHMKESRCIRTGTTVKAIATDYKGEAGANPILVIWTELWGFTLQRDLRFWAEMAPSPTRPDSLQWIETYAGYEGESELLWGQYEKTVLEGRQLTAGELGDLSAFEEAPNADSPVPCYVNERARIFAYWDEGVEGRRMPWQQGEGGRAYYDGEAGRQTELQMTRLHENRWVSAVSEFVPIEWWDAAVKPLPLQVAETTPMVIGLDAAVTGDCFGMVVISRDPDVPGEGDTPPGLAVRLVRKWDPPPGGSIDYGATIPPGPEATVRAFCRDFNVSQVAYDPYQLHDMATRLQKEGVAWFRPFTQGEERLRADKGLYDLIANRRIRHDGNLNLREHLTNANAKQAANEDTRLRIVKKSESRKIDLAVCLSMASQECLRLNL